jgi:hypothetical protein
MNMAGSMTSRAIPTSLRDDRGRSFRSAYDPRVATKISPD